MTCEEMIRKMGSFIESLIEQGYLEDKEEYEFSEISEASERYFADNREDIEKRIDMRMEEIKNFIKENQ